MSKVLLTAIAAIEIFANDFQATKGKPLTDEFAGVSAQITQDQNTISTGLHVLETPGFMSTYVYGCHIHTSAQCQGQEARPPVAYQALGRFFKHTDFVTALREASLLFEQSVGPTASISAVKSWQNRGGMEFILFHGPTHKRTYMMCHYHGASIDCHLKSKPGSGEPQ